MGVFRLFRYFLNKYPRFYRTVKKNDNQHYCDSFLLDLNAVFHPVCREIYSNDVNGKSRFLEDEKKLSVSSLEKVAFKAICNKIVEYTKIANPNKVLYLAIDGVPGLSKQAQQRKRRFVSAVDESAAKDSFDYKNITVGTKWMERLCKYIFTFFDELRQKDNYFASLEIIYNDMFVHGEGEHKIIRWMETDIRSKSYTIYSPDADMILLSMGLDKRNIFILRENVYDDIAGEYLIVSIDRLKSFIINDIKWVSPEYPYNQERIIKDFVFFLMLIGNDFLPSIPSVNTKAIEKIQTAYVTTAVEVGYLLSEKNTINLPALTGFMKSMAELEPELLLSNLNMRVIQPDSVLVNSVTRTTDVVSINMDTYSELYYKRNFEEGVTKSNVSYEYLKGMFFVIQYYLSSIPTFDWVYPYHYAPLFRDIYNYLVENPKLNITFFYRPPLTLVETLASVLHPKSFYLLPEKVNELLTNRATIDDDFSPDFTVDLEGKQNEYEGVPNIPMVSYDKIKMLLQSLKIPNKAGQIQYMKPVKFRKPFQQQRQPQTQTQSQYQPQYSQRKPEVQQQLQINQHQQQIKQQPQPQKEEEEEVVTIVF